ncbi:hypothetical protein CBR_g29557 [Chara braunii]|uniref:Uncharacterized protein n=1 Tax=Chara braunii TaxID=69332 RepID=A0A388LAS1_CHABU|nr:hypothetical protein CBR_g29557 [Chara braunii]|eukprot:GBG79410.1 hypothetical protein CBR_g29557 [Chara braunii]
MVETCSGIDTSPYTKEQQEKMVALVRENKESKEREKQAKLKAIAEEQAAKMKELEEEMEKKKKVVEEEAAAEEEKERMRIESREGSSGTKRDTDAEMERRISEWVANLSLGEDEEAESYECRKEVLAQPDDKAKWDKVLGYLEVLSKAWMEERQVSWSQDVALSAMRSGFRDFAREIVTHIGGEVRQLRDNVGKFCEGAIEGAKAIAAVEGEVRPRKEPVKLKFPDAYGGKKEENFDNWEASVNSYIYLQHILIEEQVLVAFQALKDEAASFARFLARAAGCENNLVAYSKVTPLPQFFKLLKERFADPTRGVRASDKLQTIHSRQWRSARALKGTMDGIVDEDVFRTGGRGRPQKQYKVRFAYQEPEEDRWFTRTELLETAPDIVRAYERDKKGKVVKGMMGFDARRRSEKAPRRGNAPAGPKDCAVVEEFAVDLDIDENKCHTVKDCRAFRKRKLPSGGDGE